MKYPEVKKTGEIRTEVFVACCGPLDVWEGTRSFRDMRESMGRIPLRSGASIRTWLGRLFLSEICLLQVVLLNIAGEYEPATVTLPRFGVAPDPEAESHPVLWGAIKISNNGTTFYASLSREVLPREALDTFVCEVPWFEFEEKL